MKPNLASSFVSPLGLYDDSTDIPFHGLYGNSTTFHCIEHGKNTYSSRGFVGWALTDIMETYRRCSDHFPTGSRHFDRWVC